MRKILVNCILIMIAFLSMYCNRQSVRDANSYIYLEGWLGPPDDPYSKNKERFYFYMKFKGKADPNTINKKLGSTIETSCKESSMKNAKENIIQILAKETVKGGSDCYGTGIIQRWEKIIIKEFSSTSSDTKIKECRPLGIADPNVPDNEWSQCECLTYVYIPGGRDAVLAKAARLDLD